jgi:hypothetical protein
MGQAIPAQHPAVVLRSRYTQLRMLLAVAMIAVIGLTVAVVMLAGEHDTSTTTTSAAPARSEFRVASHAAAHGGVPVPDPRAVPLPTARRSDGGPEEGTRGIVAAPAASTRSDGGPEEGSRGPGR